MSKPLPRAPRHLHVFGISLTIIVLALVVFLFGVKMEATATGAGVVTSGQLVQVRAPKSGRVRFAVPAHSSNDSRRGPVVAGGDVAGGAELMRVGDGDSPAPVRVPDVSPKWLVAELPVSDGQIVHEGDLLACLVPVDPETGALAGVLIRIEIDERQAGAVEPGQEVRLYSTMYHHRTHGVAKGVVERLEPMAVEGPNGARKFRGWVKVTESPFPMKLGSSVRAEIVTGRKRTFQIILEH